MASKIVIEKATYEVNSIRLAVDKILVELNARSILAGKKRILLKPNLLSPLNPDKGVTTKPEIIGAVIDWLIENGISKDAIVVGESSSGFSSTVTKRAFKVCGIQDLCESKGIRWVAFEGTSMVRVPLPSGKKLDHVNISEELVNADLIINLPVLKTHTLTILTCAIKNMFGSLVLTNKTQMHTQFPALPDFAEMLVDVYSATKPGLTIVDAITAIEGNGPGISGKLLNLGFLIGGADPVAIDTVCADIMGFDQKTILTTQIAEQRGLGTNNLADINIKGNQLDQVRRKFKFPRSYGIMRFFLNSRISSRLKPIMNKFTQVRAWYDKNCISCGDCVRICPGHALEIIEKGSRPTWTREKCINCHCCEEICRKGAAHVGIAGIRGVWPYLVLLLVGLYLFIYSLLWLLRLI